jgi:hypothetical protein
MITKKTPIVILGGCDREPATLPERGRGKHALRGYKGVDIRIGGRPMIQTVVERLESSGAFGPVFVAGPEAIYRQHGVSAQLIDTDGTFGQNIRAALEGVGRQHPGQPIAFTTCDILPEVETLEALMARFVAEAPCDLWCPLVRAPEDPSRLGASDWKPEYRVIPRDGAPAVATLPGHLVIADPQALRLNFIYRLFQLAYSTRNRSIGYRSMVMLRGVLAELLYQDLLHVLGLRWPTLTWDVVAWGLPATRRLRQGVITRVELEDALRRMFVTTAHRRRYPGRRVLIPIVDALSIAIDLDTEEEAREKGAVLEPGAPIGQNTNLSHLG